MMDGFTIVSPVGQQELLATNWREKITKRRMAIAAIALIAVVQNVDLLYTAAHYEFAGGSMVPTVPGCEVVKPVQSSSEASIDTKDKPDPGTDKPEPKPDEPANNTAVLENEALAVRSSTKNNRPLEVVKNQPEFWRQNDAMYDHFESSFVSKYSRMIFEIYRTEEQPEREVDQEALDRLYHLVFTTDIDHANNRIDQLMDCVENKVLVDKVWDGKVKRIVIPSTNDYCISNSIMIRVNDRKHKDCTQSGAGLPKIEVEFLMFKPFSEQYFYITAGDLNAETDEELNKKVNELLLHESMHQIFFDLGVKPRKDQDEQIVDYMIEAIQQPKPVQGPPTTPRFGLMQSPPTPPLQPVPLPRAVIYTLK